MSPQESRLDQLLRQRAEIDELLRRQQVAFSVLFTDVVGSTEYFDRYGDIAGVAMLQRHEDLARKCVEENGGRVIKNIGDSVMAEFEGPAAAVRAAVEIQQRLFRSNRTLPERERLQIRIGINHGIGFRHSGDVYGDVVNVAARITKHTGPAQILVSQAVSEAIAGEPGLRTKHMGKVAMKGKAEEGDVFEVVWTDTQTYADLRQHVTVALKRGDLVAPGLDVGELMPPAPPAPTPTPTPAGERARAETFPTPPPIRIESRYEILGELGRGGMGLVYKARDRETGDLVALKLLRPEVAADAKGMARFKNELRIARRITHKNVCRIYDLGRTEDSAYISMEYVEGESLRQVLNRSGSMSPRKGLEIARQVCAGLHEAHVQGVVHRDLKPENVMIDAAGIVKVMDFGIARASFGEHVTQASAIVGTPTYMAPEQAEGKPVDNRTDIYALGLILYEMFTGSPTFVAETPIAVAIKHMRETPVPPRELDASIPDHLERAVLKCLEKDPANRFQSVLELDAALVAEAVTTPPETMPPITVGAGAPAPTPPPGVPPSQPTPTPIPTAALPAIPAAPTAAPQPVAHQPTVPVGVAPAKRVSAGLLIGVIVIAVLAVAAVVGVYLLRQQRAPVEQAQAPPPQVVTEPAPSVAPEKPPEQPPEEPVAQPETKPAERPPAATPTQARPSQPAATPTPKPEPPIQPSVPTTAPPAATTAAPLVTATPPIGKLSVDFSLARTLSGHTGAVASVAFSPDGRLIATGSRDRTVRVWEAGTGQALQTLKGHKDGISSVAFSPDGRVVASGSLDRTVMLWDASSGQTLHTFPRETGSILCVTFSPDGRWLALSTSDGRVKIVDAASGEGMHTLEGHTGPVYAVAFSADGRWLASAGRDRTVRLWTAAGGQQARVFQGHSDAVNAVAFSPDGRTIASGSDDKTVRLWDVSTGREIHTLSGHAGGVDGVAFSPDGRWVASGSGDKTIKIWDVVAGSEVSTLSGHVFGVSEVTASRNGRWLASASSDNTVRLWRRE